METTFARWLRDRGEAHHAYATRNNYNQRAVRRLAGIGREPYTIRTFDLSFLRRVSQDTGISIETLVAEAERAARNPIKPRSYTRRENGDGKRTQTAE